MQDSLKEISSMLLDIDGAGTAVLMDEDIDHMNEKVSTPQGTEENIIEEADAQIPLQSSFLSRPTQCDRDPNQSTRTALQGRRFIILLLY